MNSDKGLDAITAIQDLVDKMTVIMYTSVGVLNQSAPLVSLSDDVPVTHWSSDQIENATKTCENLSENSTKDIIKLSLAIDRLIDSLGAIGEPIPDTMFQSLEEENKNATLELQAMSESTNSYLSQLEGLSAKIHENAN